jgi:hypothetical protein
MELIPEWTYRWFVITSALIIVPLFQLLVSGFDQDLFDFIITSLKAEMSAEEIQDIIRRVEDLINTNIAIKWFIILASILLIYEIFYG